MPAADAMAAIRDVLARAEKTTSADDLTATLAQFADLEVPETYQGGVLLELVEPAADAGH